ncbi:PTS transporter subunit EIIC [Metabacillus niabensis]|uniref:PTS transporter subunit EIIC n=1 Tax=Metabacillus niabensis TaxID=324854 RepID=UPI001CFA5C8B|nr:PTS transporter subunit EIIC [Metabacillus niabensis]
MRKFGQLLSAMIYQNIAVIIAVGIIQELFGIYGYFYNDRILLLVNPIYETLLPILLAYSGGKLVGGKRGAVVAALVVYGLTMASSVPIIIGAMFIGPFAGFIVNRIERLLKDKIPIGFEFLISNIIIAIVGVFLTIICFLYVGQLLSSGIKEFIYMLQMVIYSGWLPLAAVIIEPAKIFFFNNVINYGFLTPIGIHQAKEIGKSIFFLLESNPGPGFGVLLAYFFKSVHGKRKSLTLSMIIQSIGGIHEIYFPYILRNWKLLFAVIGGGIAGNAVFQFLNIGLVSIPSPGSIITLIGMSPKADILGVLFGIIISAIVSFILSFIILGRSLISPNEQEFETQIATLNTLQHIDHFSKINNTIEKKMEEVESSPLREKPIKKPIEKVLFVCEAGMGSSSMGAAMLRKKLKLANLDVKVNNASIQDHIDPDIDLIVCHQAFLKKVQDRAPHKIYYSFQSFTNFQEYDQLVEKIRSFDKE